MSLIRAFAQTLSQDETFILLYNFKVTCAPETFKVRFSVFARPDQSTSICTGCTQQSSLLTMELTEFFVSMNLVHSQPPAILLDFVLAQVDVVLGSVCQASVTLVALPGQPHRLLFPEFEGKVC